MIVDLINIGCGIYKGYNDSAGNYVGTLPVYLPIAFCTITATIDCAQASSELQREIIMKIKNKKLREMCLEREARQSPLSKAIHGTFTGLFLSSAEVGLGYIIGSMAQKSGL